MTAPSDETAYTMPSRPILGKAYGVGSMGPRSIRKGVSSLTTPLNSTKEGESRTYVWPPTGESFPSVTTILSTLNKPALVNWAARQAATYAVKERQRLMFMDKAAAIEEIASLAQTIQLRNG